MAQSSECRLTRGAARQCGPWVLLAAMFIASVSTLLWDGVHNSVEAQIKPSAEDEIFVLQHKPFLRKNRVELAPSFSATVNDALIQQFEIGGTLTYHLSEQFWIAGEFGWMDLGEFGGVTDEYFDVLDKTNSAPEVVEQVFFGGAQFGYVPLYGKFAIFDRAIVYYDASVYLGGGLLNHITDNSGGEVGAGAFEVGFKMRIFMNRWLALFVDVKDRFMFAELKGGSTLNQFVMVGGGVSIFMPFGFDYTTER